MSFCFPSHPVQVKFKNLASRPFSFHSSLQGYEELHGGEAVQPGEVREYSWKVLSQMAPTMQEFDCKAWAYLSNVDLVGGELCAARLGSVCGVKAFPMVLCLEQLLAV